MCPAGRGARGPRAPLTLCRGVVVGHEAEAVQHGRQLLKLRVREHAQLVGPAKRRGMVSVPTPAWSWPLPAAWAQRRTGRPAGLQLRPLPSPKGRHLQSLSLEGGQRSGVGWPTAGSGLRRRPPAAQAPEASLTCGMGSPGLPFHSASGTAPSSEASGLGRWGPGGRLQDTADCQPPASWQQSLRPCFVPGWAQWALRPPQQCEQRKQSLLS